MGKFKSKKRKKRFLLKFILIISIFYISFLLSFKFLSSTFLKKKIYNQKYVNKLVNNSTSDIIKKNNKSEDVLTILTNPAFLLSNSLSNISVVNENYFSDDDDEATYKKLKSKSSYVEDTNKRKVNNPLIYIYNSHQLENYQANYTTAYNITPNVLMASYLLREKLYDLGIEAIVEENDISAYLKQNNLKYSYSYKASRYFLDQKLSTYKSLKYIIDLHRDSLKKDKTTLTANDKNYAKTLLLIGTDFSPNDYNLNLAEKVCNLLNSQVNGICKGILKKGGKGNNGIYNQDAFNGAMLIEIGGSENTIDEVSNTVDIFAKVLKNLLEE